VLDAGDGLVHPGYAVFDGDVAERADSGWGAQEFGEGVGDVEGDEGLALVECLVVR
jgi:hypothetical protein